MKKYLILIILFFIYKASAQDLSRNLSLVAGQYAQSYLQPFINAYGAGINSGFFHSAGMNTDNNSGLNISFSIVSMGSIIPAAQKYFSAVYNTTAQFDTMGQVYNVNAKATVINAPTIFGSKTKGTVKTELNDTVVVEGIFYYPVHQTRVDQTFGGLVSTDIAPLAMPQLNIGTFLGTDISFRWIPPVKIGNYGTTNFFGAGIRHNFSQYLPALPFNLAAGFYYQNFTMKDSTGSRFINVTATAANIQISKKLGFFDVYGALQYETSSLNVSYQYVPSSGSSQNQDYTVNVNFNINGTNSFRFLAGAAYTIGRFYVNTDFNLSAIDTFTFGFGYDIF